MVGDLYYFMFTLLWTLTRFDFVLISKLFT